MYTTIAADGRGWVPVASVSAVINQNVPVIQPPAIPTPVVGGQKASPEQNLLFLDTVNIREGPGNTYKSFGAASHGTYAEAIGKSQDGAWFAIRIPTTLSPNGIGWVKADYVQVINPGSLPVLKTK
jgi:hypothetical protein